MKDIGGYPCLELPRGEEYHSGAMRLNSARACFGEILTARSIRKVYLPYYSCQVMIDELDRRGVEYIFYHIDESLNPATYPEVKECEAVLYTDYFGIKREMVRRLVSTYGNKLIVDNAQAFYEKPVDGIDTIYSPRKFFGVSDGGYMYIGAITNLPEEQDVSCIRILPQLKRIDLDAGAAYADFQNSEEELCGQNAKRMSELTRRILQGADYPFVKSKRIANYQYLHERLAGLNELSDMELPENAVPLAYPLYVKDDCLRKRLINNHVFVPTYWPNVLETCGADTCEYSLAKYLLPLPIDQRYGEEDMQTIVGIVTDALEKTTKK